MVLDSSEGEKASVDLVTAQEYLDRQAALEKEAAEVLPGKFDRCTFELGYIRQSVYACKTCSPSSRQSDLSPSGMCYSCSISCHGDHDVVELFAKRTFRCDCGVKTKFDSVPCQLSTSEKEGKENDKNTYDHNYWGRFCWCDFDYDPEKEEQTMFQCVLCEDWYHENCIGKVPSHGVFDDYICRSCTTRYPFIINPQSDKFLLGVSDKQAGDVKESKMSNILFPAARKHRGENHVEAKAEVEVIQSVNSDTSPATVSDEPNAKRIKLEQDIKDEGDDTPNSAHDGIDSTKRYDLFLKELWRDDLCRCEPCLKRYDEHHIAFLLAEEISYEPEEDEDAGTSLMDIGMKELMKMDRVQAIEGLMAYNTWAAHIKEFLKRIGEQGRPVTKEDVDGFFEELENERLKRKRDSLNGA